MSEEKTELAADEIVEEAKKAKKKAKKKAEPVVAPVKGDDPLRVRKERIKHGLPKRSR